MSGIKAEIHYLQDKNDIKVHITFFNIGNQKQKKTKTKKKQRFHSFF